MNEEGSSHPNDRKTFFLSFSGIIQYRYFKFRYVRWPCRAREDLGQKNLSTWDDVTFFQIHLHHRICCLSSPGRACTACTKAVALCCMSLPRPCFPSSAATLKIKDQKPHQKKELCWLISNEKLPFRKSEKVCLETVSWLHSLSTKEHWYLFLTISC